LYYINSYSYRNKSSNERLKNEISKVQHSLNETYSNSLKYFKENKKNSDSGYFVLNDMIMEKLDKNKSLNKIRSRNYNNTSFKTKIYLNTTDSNNNYNTISSNRNYNHKINKKYKPIITRKVKSSSMKIRNGNSKEHKNVKGRCYYDELRQLQIRILKKS
jgi:hypothetical protein